MGEESKEYEQLISRFLQGPVDLESTVSPLSEEQLDQPLKRGEWSIRQYVHHIVDGDDIWKGFIKQALTGKGGCFSLEWYWTTQQVEWAGCWNYAGRAIAPSLALLHANRAHIAQLLQSCSSAWGNTLSIRWPGVEQAEQVSVRDVLEMQTGHLEGHLKDIREFLATHPD